MLFSIYTLLFIMNAVIGLIHKVSKGMTSLHDFSIFIVLIFYVLFLIMLLDLVCRFIYHLCSFPIL